MLDVQLLSDRLEIADLLTLMVLPQEDGSELLWEFGGYYRHALVRKADGWRSRELTEELVWKRGT